MRKKIVFGYLPYIGRFELNLNKRQLSPHLEWLFSRKQLTIQLYNCIIFCPFCIEKIASKGEILEIFYVLYMDNVLFFNFVLFALAFCLFQVKISAGNSGEIIDYLDSD
jgi:hypothetical protein